MKEQSLSQRLHMDIPLLFGIMVLCGIGLVVLYSASDQNLSLVLRQSIRMAIAVTLMIVVAQIPPQTLSRWSLWVYLAGVGLLILVLGVGYVGKGAQRWLDLGLFRFQPSELMKLALPMVLAWYFAERPLPPTFTRISVALVMIGLSRKPKNE